MQIEVNGQEKEVAAGMTVASLLESMSLQPLRVAVEVNRDLVPRSGHGDKTLGLGDVVEIVTLVGGG